jgi:arginase
MKRPLVVIEAPSNLGLRPLRPGHVPGTWRARRR